MIVSAPALTGGGTPAPASRAADVYGEVLGVTRDIYKRIAPQAAAARGRISASGAPGVASSASDRPSPSDGAAVAGPPPEESEPPSAGSLPLPREAVAKITALLRAGDQEILALADRSASDHFLFGHVANVAIFSLRLGMAVEIPADDLETLGLCAFLHDIGLADQMELAARPARFTEEEARAIRVHAEEGKKRLDFFSGWTTDLKATVAQVIGETHARSRGGGEAGSGSSEDIHPFAKIIGLTEVYEALTHMRPWRPRTVPHDVLRSFVEENAAEFDPGLIRSLVETLSLYPPGSFVRLSTGDVGRVLTANAGLPLRPRVWLMIDPQGRRVEGNVVLNLAVKPAVFITDAVDETKIRTADPRLALALRAQRWWVRGL